MLRWCNRRERVTFEVGTTGCCGSSVIVCIFPSSRSSSSVWYHVVVSKEKEGKRSHFVLMLALSIKVRSASSSTPTWLTGPSPGNRLRPATRGTALQECPCRARPRCLCSGTSSGSTRQLCREPFRCRESASQDQNTIAIMVARPIQCKCVGSSVVQHQPDQRAHLVPDSKAGRDGSVLSRRCSEEYRHPTAFDLKCQTLILTSSLGTRIGRAEPRRTDLRRRVSR